MSTLDPTKCQAIIQAGRQCSRPIKPSGYCTQHEKMFLGASTGASPRRAASPARSPARVLNIMPRGRSPPRSSGPTPPGVPLKWSVIPPSNGSRTPYGMLPVRSPSPRRYLQVPTR